MDLSTNRVKQVYLTDNQSMEERGIWKCLTVNLYI